jgi:ABC-type lipoprotein export system ATPase subunit
VTHDPKAAEYASITLNLDKGNLVSEDAEVSQPVQRRA